MLVISIMILDMMMSIVIVISFLLAGRRCVGEDGGCGELSAVWSQHTVNWRLSRDLAGYKTTDNKLADVGEDIMPVDNNPADGEMTDFDKDNEPAGVDKEDKLTNNELVDIKLADVE